MNSPSTDGLVEALERIGLRGPFQFLNGELACNQCGKEARSCDFVTRGCPGAIARAALAAYRTTLDSAHQRLDITVGKVAILKREVTTLLESDRRPILARLEEAERLLVEGINVTKSSMLDWVHRARAFLSPNTPVEGGG